MGKKRSISSLTELTEFADRLPAAYEAAGERLGEHLCPFREAIDKIRMGFTMAGRRDYFANQDGERYYLEVRRYDGDFDLHAEGQTYHEDGSTFAVTTRVPLDSLPLHIRCQLLEDRLVREAPDGTLEIIGSQSDSHGPLTEGQLRMTFIEIFIHNYLMAAREQRGYLLAQ